VPTPFTVALTATSVTDTTKSASSPVIVAGKIASVSQTISASAGGTITLQDGSSVTIPAGLLAADQTVTLTENSVPLNQTQNQLLVGTGPALYLSFSGPLQTQSAATRDTAGISRSATTGGLLAGLSFNFNFGVNLPSVASTEAALASFTNQAGEVVYQGLSATQDAINKTAVAFVNQACIALLNSALGSPQTTQLTIGVYFVELAARPPNSPTQGLLVWNPSVSNPTTGTNGQFLPFQQCPAPVPRGEKTLVVIHGMLSSVEGSYTNMLATSNFISSGHYGSIFGIDYDWWNGLQQNGKTTVVAGYLDQVAACSPGVPIDILAHSEGVPVTISALTQDTAAKSSVQHFIAVAGPILGTPLANVVAGPLGTGRYTLLTAIGNFPPLQMVFPPASPGGLLDLLNDQFAKDLATDSSGSGVLAGMRNLWIHDPVLSQLPIVMVGGTFPDPKVAGLYIPLGPCITNCFGDFQQEPFDGVVGLDSAFGAGLDIPLYRIPARPLFHTEMVGNIGVLEDIERQLNDSQPPKLEIASSSTDALCVDSHFCSGPPGSVFTFTGSRFTPGKPLSIYVQDPTGTEDTPSVVNAQADGTLTWTDPTPPSKVPGNYGVWVYDLDSGASISVIEAICSGNCGSSAPAGAIVVSPLTAQVPVGGHQAFTPTVTGLSNTAVTWSVNGSIGGDTTVGTISAAGLYTAPATVPSPTTVTVTATSQADASVSGSASVTIEPAGAVTISPASATVTEGGTQQFMATVLSGGTVNWSVQEGSTGGTITSAGVYTAPNTAGTFHVVATSALNSSQSATAAVTVVAPGNIGFNWTRSWGGSGDDIGNGVATDSAGNVYVAGSTTSFGAGGQDVLLVKYGSAGNVLWAKTWGGPGDDFANAVLADQSGNVYVVGATDSFGAGWYDALILKFDSSGNLVWARTWGGSSFDVGYDLSFDQSGNLAIAAESYSLGNTTVLLKLSTDGALLGSYTWKGPATYDSGYSLTVDASGNTVMTGTSWDYGVNPYHNTILLLKYDSQGNLLWNRNWAGPSEDEITGRKTVRTDALGNIYIAGQTSDSCTTGNFSLCNFDVLLLKIDPNGNLLWARKWGGTGYGTANALLLDSSNDIDVVGSTTGFFSGIQSALIQQYDSNGNVLVSKVLATSAASGWNTIIANPSGALIAAGSGPNDSGAWQDTGISSVTATGSLSTPTGTVNSPSVILGTPSGSTANVVGVIDTGGGGADVLSSTFSIGAP
jgi:hypothetical protein